MPVKNVLHIIGKVTFTMCVVTKNASAVAATNNATMMNASGVETSMDMEQTYRRRLEAPNASDVQAKEPIKIIMNINENNSSSFTIYFVYPTHSNYFVPKPSDEASSSKPFLDSLLAMQDLMCLSKSNAHLFLL